MATAGERLAALAGVTGTAAALLLAIGSGATTGAALVDYSGLPSATAAEHLLASGAPQAEQPDAGGAAIRHRQGRRRRVHSERPEVDLPPMLPEILPPFIPVVLPAPTLRIRARQVRDAETVVFLAP